MNFTDTKGEWPQIKAYIDQSAQNTQSNAIFSMFESYLQAQLKPLGLTCCVGDVISSNTFNANYSKYAINQFIGKAGGSYVLDTKTGVISFVNKNYYSISGRFSKYFIGYNGNSGHKVIMDTTFKTALLPENFYNTKINGLTGFLYTTDYLFYFYKGAILCFDKNLNFVTKYIVVDIPEQFDSSDYINSGSNNVYDAGDNGIYLTGYFQYKINDSFTNAYFKLMFKNGEFYIYDGSIDYANYVKNGNKYELSQLILITNNLSISLPKKYELINRNGKLVTKIAEITNLSSGVAYPICVDQCLFGTMRMLSSTPIETVDTVLTLIDDASIYKYISIFEL